MTQSAPNPNPLDAEELRLINAWWRACNYLSVGMIYLRDNPLLKEPLKIEDVKHRLLGHSGASPALSFTWAHPIESSSATIWTWFSWRVRAMAHLACSARSASAVVAAAAPSRPPRCSAAPGSTTRDRPATSGSIRQPAVFGRFDDPVRPWEGTLQAIYSDQFRDLDGRLRRQVRDHRDPPEPVRRLRAVARRAASTGACRRALELRCRRRAAARPRRRRGSVGRDGEPFVAYRLSAYDTRHVRAGVDGRRADPGGGRARGACLLALAVVPYEPGRGSAGSSSSRRRRVRLGRRPLHLRLVPPDGHRRMGGSAATSACGPEGRLGTSRDLVVCDGSSSRPPRASTR